MQTRKESSTVELKRELTPMLKKELIAFANTDGGEVYIGIEDDGTIVGVSDAGAVMERISNLIRDGIKPDLTPYTSVQIMNEDGLDVLLVTVSRGAKRPYHLSEKGLKPSGVYVRLGTTSAPASEEAIRQMLRDSDGTAFDQSRSPNQSLTFTFAAEYFAANNVAFTDHHKRTLKLIDADGYFTNAALLLSDQCETSIKCAVYEGTGKMKFKARKAFFGSVFKQLEDAFEFISLNNNLHSSFVKLKRVDLPDYPPAAIREALINTVVHRDYDYTGSTLIHIFDDRIEFVSLGGLVKGITLEDIMHGVSQTRNNHIANIFYRLELIESYGTGIQRIKESYENSTKQPLFEPAPASFRVILPNRNRVDEPSFAPEVTKEEKVLQLLEQQGSVTRKDVEQLLACSEFPARTLLHQLLDGGKIAKVGSARATKYVLAK